MIGPRRPDDSRPDPRSPDEARLSELFSDAVSDVEPREALDSIRTRTKGTPMSARRPWTYAVGGAVVATAALVGAVAFAGDQLGLTGSGDDGAPAAAHHSRHHGKAHPSRTPDVSTPATGDPGSSASPVAEPPAADTTVAVYYVGDTPQGPRLYREFTQVRGDGDVPVQAVEAAVARSAHDPDYGSPWNGTGASIDRVTDDGPAITVDVVTGDPMSDRPDGMTADEATMALQQVVYTAQAVLQTRDPVRVFVNDHPVDRFFGIDTSHPLANHDAIDTLALVSISDPSEGATVSGSFTASGVASSFEANVPWQVRQGDTVVKKGFATAEGWMDKLYPWQTKVDVSGLAPGTYTFVAMTDDPSSGEGGGPHVDTRTITVQ